VRSTSPASREVRRAFFFAGLAHIQISNPPKGANMITKLIRHCRGLREPRATSAVDFTASQCNRAHVARRGHVLQVTPLRETSQGPALVLVTCRLIGGCDLVGIAQSADVHLEAGQLVQVFGCDSAGRADGVARVLPLDDLSPSARA
jgi:hypothetical protein